MSLIYRRSIAVLDKFVPQKLQPLWNHDAVLRERESNTVIPQSVVAFTNQKPNLAGNIKSGPKTVFFWAPIVKWGLVIAGIGDLTRPAEKLSISQSASLAATGCIWARYSLVIIPKNWSLFSVNMFVAGTSLFQLFRAIRYQQSLKAPQEAIQS